MYLEIAQILITLRISILHIKHILHIAEMGKQLFRYLNLS